MSSQCAGNSGKRQDQLIRQLDSAHLLIGGDESHLIRLCFFLQQIVAPSSFTERRTSGNNSLMNALDPHSSANQRS